MFDLFSVIYVVFLGILVVAMVKPMKKMKLFLYSYGVLMFVAGGLLLYFSIKLSNT